MNTNTATAMTAAQSQAAPQTQGPTPAEVQAAIETWNPKRPIQWAKLPDEALFTIGAQDSVDAVSRAVSGFMRSPTVAKDVALAVAHSSVICPESADGIVHLDSLLPYYERVAFGLGDEPASVADRVTCALAIFLNEKSDADGGALLERTQRCLSGLLLDHPALLHPRMVLPVRNPRSMRAAYMSVFTAMMMTDRAQLPSVRHGLDETRVRAFAKSALIMAPISRAAPRRAHEAGASARGVYDVEHHGVTLTVKPGAFGKVHPEMLASFLELARLRRKDDRWPGNHRQVFDEACIMTSMEAALPRSMGLHHFLVTKTGTRAVRRHACEHFLDEVAASRLLSDVHHHTGRVERSEIVRRLPFVIQRAVFWSDGTVQPKTPGTSHMPAWIAEANTALQLALLQRVGLARDGLEAAAWLHRELVVGGERETRALPYVSMDQAFGFLTALAATGWKVPAAPPSNVTDSGELKGTAEAHDTWTNAHAIVSRKQAMEAVFSQAAEAPEAAPHAPARRRSVQL